MSITPKKNLSQIYSVPWGYMKDESDIFLTILEKYVLRHMIIVNPQPVLLAKSKKDLENYLEINKPLKKVTIEYIKFLQAQKEIFGQDSFYDISFNKSTRGFQLSIKRPTNDTSTSFDILSTSVYDLQTSSNLYPILKITPDNYVEEIKKLASKNVVFDEQKLINKIKELSSEKSFDFVLAEIATAYIARIDEYKVHLQVKPEYQFWVLKKLNSMIREDKTFMDCIDAIKMHNFYDIVYSKETLVPSIVIYLSGNNLKQTIQEKTECLKTVLSRLICVFRKYSKKIGLDITPRYNYKYDEFIYFTNGPGDVKTAMEKDDILDDFFIKSCNYSFLKTKEQILTEYVKSVFEI